MATASRSGARPGVDLQELREVVATLGKVPRPSASPAEREAAEWIAARLRQHGCAVAVEEERAYGGFWWPILGWTALGVASGVAALRGRRLLGFLGATAAALGIADETAAGPYLFRRALMRPRPTWNVVAEAGDADAAQTVVILAHHDSAHSGVLFHPAVPKWMYEHFPEQVEKADQSLPYWVALLSSVSLVAAGSLVGRGLGRAVTKLGVLLSAAGAALLADIARRPAVPGANDNLSGVAVLVHVARALHERPVSGLRVLLVSCGSEESLQEGILAFGRRHFPGLPLARTNFLVVDTVGSPSLVMIEGEGTLAMRDYSTRLNELLASLAKERGIALQRGLRLRSSTDACIPNREGYPTALLVSINKYRAASNYHWPTDTPENVDYGTVAACSELTEAFVRKLASAAEPAAAGPVSSA